MNEIDIFLIAITAQCAEWGRKYSAWLTGAVLSQMGATDIIILCIEKTENNLKKYISIVFVPIKSKRFLKNEPTGEMKRQND